MKDSKNKLEFTSQDLQNLKDLFDCFIESPEDVIYYTGLKRPRAEEVYETVRKIRVDLN